MIRFILALAFAALAPAGAALAQEAEAPADSAALVHAPPIVVTANRAPTAAARVASSVTVVNREQIERRQLATVLEVLRGVPGAAIVQNGGPGGVASAFLRGAGADHALVLVDGVEVNDAGSPTNAADLAHLLTAGVERIEVLRGPQSTLYGSSAMGGVIQIFTLGADGGPARGSVHAEAGSFGTTHLSASASGGTARLAAAASIASRHTDGISAAPADLGNRERDEHRSTAGSARLVWRGERVEAGAAVRGVDAANGIDQGTPTGDDPNYDSDAREVSGRAWVALASAGGAWRQTIAVTLARLEREARDEPDPARPADRSLATSEGTRKGAQWIHEIALVGRLLAGAEIEQEAASSAFSSEGAFGPFESRFPEESARTASVFLHHESERGPLVVGLGARLDDHDRFGTHATFRVTPVLALGPATRLKATLGTGFKAPTLFQLFDPEFGDSHLDPETSRGWDAGVEQDLAGGRVRLGATVFAAEFEDLVGFEFPDGYRNVSAASARGMEASASVLAGSAVRLRADYTFTDAEDESQGTPDSGLPLLRRSRHQAGVALEFAPSPRMDVGVEVRYVGERDDKDFGAFPAERVTLDAYAVARVTASAEVARGVRVIARLENAFDEEYREVFGFGTPGRAVHVGVRAAF